jgi:hypothetical protein
MVLSYVLIISISFQTRQVLLTHIVYIRLELGCTQFLWNTPGCYYFCVANTHLFLWILSWLSGHPTLDQFFFCFETTMPPRSKAQKDHLAAMRALRAQEGGSGLSVSTCETCDFELQTAREAQDSAETALELVEEQLHAEQDRSKSLSYALCLERQKVTRTKAAKAISHANVAEAQSSFKELESQFQQLTLKNEQLEQTMIMLLESFAGERKIAMETLENCKQKLKALQEKSRRIQQKSSKTADQLHEESQKFSLMAKGVYTDEARQLCRLLTSAGCSQDLVGGVVEDILATAGITVVGPTMSGRTVAWSILEGGIMADIQLGHEISKTSGLTVSGDGTTHKNVGYESRHINMLVPTYESTGSVKHKSHFLGVDSATDHSSQTQADGWTTKIQGF